MRIRIEHVENFSRHQIGQPGLNQARNRKSFRCLGSINSDEAEQFRSGSFVPAGKKNISILLMDIKKQQI
jgi:hypothetical protein